MTKSTFSNIEALVSTLERTRVATLGAIAAREAAQKAYCDADGVRVTVGRPILEALQRDCPLPTTDAMVALAENYARAKAIALEARAALNRADHAVREADKAHLNARDALKVAMMGETP